MRILRPSPNIWTLIKLIQKFTQIIYSLSCFEWLHTFSKHRSLCIYCFSIDSVCELLNFLYLSSQQPKLRVARVALYCGCVTLLRSFFSRQDLFFHSFSQHLKTTAQTTSFSQSTLNKVRAAQKNSLKHHIWREIRELLLFFNEKWSRMNLIINDARWSRRQ